MSVIGPRPALWNQDVLIAEREKYHANDVKPGLTGWAQINGRDELEIPVKAKLDGEYVEKESLLFDIKCFLGTIGSVLSSDGVVEGGTGELTKAGVEDAGYKEETVTELLKTANCGQFSVNISKPGITKGEHWHNSKWEFFIVVSGHGLIQERKIGTDEVIEFEVSGEKIEAIHMLPGYTHNIINLSEIENLVTVMWANEQFDPNHPDTFFERVKN